MISCMVEYAICNPHGLRVHSLTAAQLTSNSYTEVYFTISASRELCIEHTHLPCRQFLNTVNQRMR